MGNKLAGLLLSRSHILSSHVMVPFLIGAAFKAVAVVAPDLAFAIVVGLGLIALAYISVMIVLDLRGIRLWRYPSTTKRELFTVLVVPTGMALMILLLFILLSGTATAHQISPGFEERDTPWRYAVLLSVFFGIPLGLIVGLVALFSIGLFPPRYSR